MAPTRGYGETGEEDAEMRNSTWRSTNRRGIGGRGGWRSGCAAALVFLLWTAAPGAILGQQLVTDDATAAAVGGCELEAWVGEQERWVLPACRIIPMMEVTAGATFFDSGSGSLDPHGVLEGKFLRRERNEALGFQLGAAFSPDPFR